MSLDGLVARKPEFSTSNAHWCKPQLYYIYQQRVCKYIKNMPVFCCCVVVVVVVAVTSKSHFPSKRQAVCRANVYKTAPTRLHHFIADANFVSAWLNAAMGSLPLQATIQVHIESMLYGYNLNSLELVTNKSSTKTNKRPWHVGKDQVTIAKLPSHTFISCMT